jgi:hypothetical protein
MEFDRSSLRNQEVNALKFKSMFSKNSEKIVGVAFLA